MIAEAQPLVPHELRQPIRAIIEPYLIASPVLAAITAGRTGTTSAKCPGYMDWTQKYPLRTAFRGPFSSESSIFVSFGAQGQGQGTPRSAQRLTATFHHAADR